MARCITVILGGGRGTRLHPLTASRAKPAVPLAGKYRLIDIPLSNAINSGLKHIYVLTQFRSNSLNDHILRTYRFDMFSEGHVEILAAEQTEEIGDDWYQGTADAVRKTLHHMVRRDDIEEILILSGDHLYRMDYRALLETHRSSGADLTVSCIPVTREQCEGFGVMAVDPKGSVTSFVEKPGPEVDLRPFRLAGAEAAGLGDRMFMASMGVYVFSRAALVDELGANDTLDFGRDIIPSLIGRRHVVGHVFDGYWEDIGTTQSFYEANLALAAPDPPFSFFHPRSPIYTRQRFLPPSKIAGAEIGRSMISDGCLISAESIQRSVIGVRSRISAGSRLEDVIMMGCDAYEPAPSRQRNRERGLTGMGIGPDCQIQCAIIDKDARIAEGCVIQGRLGGVTEHHARWSVVDGIVVVRKGAVIDAGTRIIVELIRQGARRHGTRGPPPDR